MSWTEAEVKAALTRMGQREPRTATPALPSLQTRYPEETAMQTLWHAAEAHGWTPDMHWFPTGPYAGLWCECIRGTDVLRVLIHRSGKALTRDQQAWLATLQATGKFEVVVCEVERIDEVLTRLQEKSTTPP
jgi:hypothetical protein